MRRAIPVLFVGLAALFFLGHRRKIADEVAGLCSQWAAEDRFEAFQGSLGQDVWGRWRLFSAEVSSVQGARPVGCDVWISDSDERLEPGRSVRVYGRPRCLEPLRNPGALEDGLIELTLPRVWVRAPTLVPSGEGRGILFDARVAFENWLGAIFDGFPRMAGFERAIWLGDMRGLPSHLLHFYREGGLLPLLALSGQHVAGLLLCLSCLQWIPLFLLRLYFPGPANVFLVRWRRIAPTLCAFFLWVTSGGAPPISRTLAMALSVSVLKARGLVATHLQILKVSLLLLVIWDYSNAASISFLLSAIGTGATLLLISEVKLSRRMKIYFVMSLAIPLLMMPVSSFFFARVPLLAPVYQVLLSWIWDLFLIPVGFGLPLMLGAMGVSTRHWALSIFEDGWELWLRGHVWLESMVGNYYVISVRPRWYEWLVVECLVLGVVLRFERWVLRR
jgi:hypothetical protein